MYSYQTTDTSNINMMLNSNDVRYYIKGLYHYFEFDHGA